MGEHVFDADLSVSVPMLDSLMEPKGVIGEAQAMAAKAFGARRTFFATNGTSTANKVIFQTLLAPGREAAARPQLPQERAPRRGALGRAPDLPRLGAEPEVRPLRPGSEKNAAEGNQKHPDAQALILTSCTYDGLRYDLAPIIEAAHAARHQGDHRRGLVRLRALPSRVPAHRARGRRRLRHAVDAQGAVGVLAGLDDPRQRSGVPRAPVPRELQHAHLHQPAVRADREPGRGAQAGGDGGLQAARRARSSSPRRCAS